MEIILLDKPAYTKEEYKRIRASNREICRMFPEYYGSKQLEWSPTYEIKVDGVAYVFDVWNKGTLYIRKEFKPLLQKYDTFKTMFVLGKRLPKNIDYACYRRETELTSNFYYVSHTCKFEVYSTENIFKVIPYYGSNEEIKEVILNV